MILPKPKDAIHKAWLYRLLTALTDNSQISHNIYFKGGTCASMLNWLDRFSVDLDFDLKKEADKETLRSALHRVFKTIGLKLKDESKRALQFWLKYQSGTARSTIKLDILDKQYVHNSYRPAYLQEIDRYVVCQTRETMVAHKLCAVEDRYRRFKSIAGRDIYDIDYFLLHGYNYNHRLIKERTGKTAAGYFRWLYAFIKTKVNQTIINQDLNSLLPDNRFQAVRKNLKQEVLMLLQDEIKRIS